MNGRMCRQAQRTINLWDFLLQDAVVTAIGSDGFAGKLDKVGYPNGSWSLRGSISVNVGFGFFGGEAQ